MATETVKVPDLGGAEAVEVIEIPIAVGDEIDEESTLLVLESDKASMDVPSPFGGKVAKILVKLGDTVSQGTPIVEMETGGQAETGDESESGAEPEAAEPVRKEEADETMAEKPISSTKKSESRDQAIELPDLGTDDSVDVIEIAVSAGDEVAEGDTLMTLEGDKATMDVPSPFSGIIGTIDVKVGDKVKSGDRVGTASANSAEQSAADADITAEPEPVDAGKHVGPENESPKLASSSHSGVEGQETALDEPEAPTDLVYAGPMVRQTARELGVDLRNVEGSGRKGRIQVEDVQKYVKKALDLLASGKGREAAGGGIPSVKDIDFSQFGEVEEVALSRIARATAANMTRSWLNVPAVTQFDDADVTELESFRAAMKGEAEKRGVKLTPVAFIMLAVGRLLREHAVINRSWHSSGDTVIQKRYVHVGLAVDTPKGLVVPVVRDVDKKGVFELAEDIAVLAGKARDGKLTTAEMQGGSITISSLGAIGGRGFTPIVNTPESAILGVSKTSIQPVWNGNEFAPRQMLPLSFTYDHRLINGVDGGKFLTDLVSALADIRRLLL